MLITGALQNVRALPVIRKAADKDNSKGETHTGGWRSGGGTRRRSLEINVMCREENERGGWRRERGGGLTRAVP